MPANRRTDGRTDGRMLTAAVAVGSKISEMRIHVYAAAADDRSLTQEGWREGKDVGAFRHVEESSLVATSFGGSAPACFCATIFLQGDPSEYSEPIEEISLGCSAMMPRQ